MLKVAITGNIAAGKTQVETMLAKKFPVYDADKIAHEILGNVDRKKLGEQVFRDPELRKKLEEYIHPKVKDKILDIFNSNKDIVFVSIPLLFETGFDKMFDKIILITADDNLRLKRLMQRNNLSEEQALLRMNSQLSQNEKIAKSDFVIYNNTSLEELESQLKKVLKEILNSNS